MKLLSPLDQLIIVVILLIIRFPFLLQRRRLLVDLAMQRRQPLVFILVHLLIVVVVLIIVIHLIFNLESGLFLLCCIPWGQLWVIHSRCPRRGLGRGLSHHHCQLVQYLEKLQEMVRVATGYLKTVDML
jgi:hypothetical protein